jgi:hypothetical protein
MNANKRLSQKELIVGRPTTHHPKGGLKGSMTCGPNNHLATKDWVHFCQEVTFNSRFLIPSAQLITCPPYASLPNRVEERIFSRGVHAHEY